MAVPTGASITGKATEVKVTAGNNTVTCAAAHMVGTLTANANGTVAEEILPANTAFTGTSTGSDCTSTGLGPVKVTVNSRLCLHITKGTDIGSVTGCTGAVTFSLNITNLGITCHYEKASIGVEITTTPADAQVKVLAGENIKKENPDSVFCPPEGELDMEFTLTTTDGTTLTFS
ncbi:MAG TPA: hypothetical protein VFP21_05995 [Solirubrobacterales bacterium]|nr:hypothetical protein [Solirubrobacterales bacterium]